MEDSQVVTSFLNALYGREAMGWADKSWLEIRYLAEGGKPVQRWYKPQDVPLDKLRAGNQAGRNIYFGVGLRRRGSPIDEQSHQRGGEDHEQGETSNHGGADGRPVGAHCV